jgi:3-hydroxyacyl-CoA dehydrogenase
MSVTFPSPIRWWRRGGWYAYDANGNRTPDPAVTQIIEDTRAAKGIQPRSFTQEQIQLRLLAVMANEGAKELSEGIALRPSDIDLAFVNGYGFPRLKGGPMHAADTLGLATILTEIKAAHATAGAGSEPAELLAQLAAEGKTFADWQKASAPKGGNS